MAYLVNMTTLDHVNKPISISPCINKRSDISMNSTHSHANKMSRQAKLVKQLIDTLTLMEIERTADNTTADVDAPVHLLPEHDAHHHRLFIGQSRDFVGPRIFGGQVLGQALMAAALSLHQPLHRFTTQTQTAPSDDKLRPCHSLHGYFLRGGDVRLPVYYHVQTLRDGRSLSARRVTAIQIKHNKDNQPIEQIIFSMIASFAPMEGGLEFQPPMPVYPPPEDLLSEQELKNQVIGKIPDALQERFMRERHIHIKPVTPRDPIDPQPMPPKQANWLCVPQLGALDQLGIAPIYVQQALLAFSSDFYLVGTGLMAHGISFMTKGLQVASIDHSMHFHRPFDMNDWLLYDMWSDNTANAKGLNHGQFWQHGQLIATTQQEGLMRLRKSDSIPAHL